MELETLATTEGSGMQPEIVGGRYRVLRAIGRGGMGTVWLCRDETLAREVAVKEVGLLPGQSVTDTARALREARSTAALSHPNVVSVYDVVQEDDRVWMVMEYVPSRTLSHVIHEEGAIEPSRVAAIGAQLADGLAAAHAAGVTHRDVKPANVFLADKGVAKIGDFGLSRTAGDPTLTQSGMLTGTPSYFSPEVATGSEPSPASDVWALGATLYAAVEGRPPYPPRENPVAVLHEIAHQPPPRPRRAEGLEPVLTRMLDRDPTTRWSMKDARDALRRIADRSDERTRTLADPSPTTVIAPPRDPTERSGPDEPHRKRRGGALLVGLVALLAAVAAVVVAVQLTGGDGGTNTPTAGDTPAAADPPAGTPSQEGGESTPAQSTPAEAPPDGRDRPNGTTTPAAAGDAAGFVDGYFDTVPDDLDAGWSMLSPGYQAETGRSSYDGFWSTVAAVDATDLTAVQGGRAVETTVVYEYEDGRTVEERQRVYLTDAPDGPLIDGYDTI